MKQVASILLVLALSRVIGILVIIVAAGLILTGQTMKG